MIVYCSADKPDVGPNASHQQIGGIEHWVEATACQ